MRMLLGPKFGDSLLTFLIKKENLGQMLCLAEDNSTGI